MKEWLNILVIAVWTTYHSYIPKSGLMGNSLLLNRNSLNFIKIFPLFLWNASEFVNGNLFVRIGSVGSSGQDFQWFTDKETKKLKRH